MKSAVCRESQDTVSEYYALVVEQTKLLKFLKKKKTEGFPTRN
jgi:hypothetical protein